MRVAASALALRSLTSAQQWVDDVRARIRFAADGGAQVVLLPEYATSSLLSLGRDWQEWTGLWLQTMQTAARDFRLLVVGGTHLVHEGGNVLNRALLAFPDGTLDHQDKLHPTPWERRWKLPATHEIRLFRFAGATFAVPICYDVEFPEASRRAAEAGAEILLVPSWTDDDHGFWRVRHCAQARCIENVVYAVHAPLVGGLPTVDGFEQACGAAGVLTPCDTGFHRGGLAADGGWNQPITVLADLDLQRLRHVRSQGTVTPLTDARPVETYRVQPTV